MREVNARLAGIVLAGGASTRFGGDKLAAGLDGRPLLWHALDPLAGLVGEIVVVAAHDGPAPALPEPAAPARSLSPSRPMSPARPNLALVRDPIPAGGPLVGLLAGLRATTAPVAVVIGGDMPFVRPAIVEALVASLAAAPEDAGLAALLEGGRLRPLPCVVRVVACREAAERIVAAGARSLRSLADAVGAFGVVESTWRPLDPEGVSLRDVDTPADLARLPREKPRPSG